MASMKGKGDFFVSWKPVEKFYQAKLLKQHYFKEHNISIGMHYESTDTAI